ncbi:collagen-like protein [Streptomyces sp. NPDC126510]|uniref:collagen-like protein n=1 Tax=Streptomyces sp. NPDC126510 TaxID=3155317 RepID=UPI003327627A
MNAWRKMIRRPRLPRAEWLIAVTGAVFVLFMGWLAVQVITQAHDLRATAGHLRDANRARDLLAEQVQRLGGKPVAGPPGSRGAPGKSIVGSPGPAGERGADGRPGEPAPTITPSRGPSGPPGQAGQDGADSTVPGPSGAPGAESTVAGPPGPEGREGPPGPAGQDGSDGRDGEDGRAPAGWTFTYEGVTYRCGPVDGFDPGAPRYDCQPDQVPPSEPSPTPQAALSPFRREYG